MLKATPSAADASGISRVVPVDALKRLTIRGVLFAGFGLIFVLWIVSSVDLVRRLVEAEERVSAVNAHVMTADNLLSTIRIQVLLSSIYLRDALLDAPDQASLYRKQLQDTRTAVDRALEAYVPVANSTEEREGVGRLKAELADFWTARLAVVDWDLTRRSAEVSKLLRQGVVPQREVIMRISGGIQELHRASLEEQRLELSRIYGAMRRRVWFTGGMVLALSAGIAVLVTLHASRLERRIQQQRVRDQQNARDLQRLSARLVTAQEEERRTIARELHDEVGQALTSIRLELAVAERALGPQAGDLPALKEVRVLSERALQSVRDLSQLLHPALLDDIGLPAALDLYLRSFSTRTGVRAELLHDRMEDRLAAETEVCLYRIAQEALTNVARHASASSCRVYLQRLSSTVVMTVEDDGKGFNPRPVTADAPRQGLGLLGIQERVSGLRGSLRLESAPGTGTRLTVEVPALPRMSAPDVGSDGPTASGLLEGRR